MSAGGQSGSNSNYNTSNGTSSFNNSGTSNQTGNQTGSNSSSGSQNGTTTANQSGTTGVNTTGIYNTASGNAAGNINPSGLTSTQQQAQDFQAYQLQHQPVNWGLSNINDQIGAALAGQAPSISSGTGASFMAPYENQYANDVLNPSLNAFDQGVAIQNNGVRASRDAGSAFGDRADVADSVNAGINNTARGALAGSITGQGFNTAVGAGQSDAANSLTGQTAQAQADLQSKALKLQGAQQQAGNLETIDNNGNTAATSLYNMGGGGQSQNINLAGSQVPAFGTNSSSTGSGTNQTDFNSVANSIMNSIMNGSTTSQGTGATFGSSTGGGSSKGGGLSIPFL